MAIKVFIVEDEIDVLEMYREVMEDEGFDVVGWAFDGVEAVRRYAGLEQKPDVVIMDYRIPLKTGVEAAREIMSMDPEARIIFASADDSARKEALELGAVSFKKKPFTVDRLIENIEKHARRPNGVSV